MGVLYNKTDNGRTLRIISSDLRERILNEFYFKHHSMLSRAVKYQLQTYGKALILDCHSFPNTPLKRSVHQTIPRPEINIGTDNFHTPQKLIDFSVEYFTNRNFTIGLNYPFSGTIVPMEYYRKNNKIESIMLEINRKLYLREISNEKSEHYKVTKLAVQEYIELLRNKL